MILYAPKRDLPFAGSSSDYSHDWRVPCGLVAILGNEAMQDDAKPGHAKPSDHRTAATKR
jgi:hypothetical protein